VVEFAAASCLLIALTAIAVWQRNRRPYLLIGWLWFLGMLVPVSGIIQVGFQQRADRYLYLAQLGLFLAVVWCVAEMVRTSRRATIVSSFLFAVILVGCVRVTVTQVQVWKNTKTLWLNAYRLDPSNRPAIFSLFKSALAEGKGTEAVRLADELIVLENERHHDFLLRVCDELMKHAYYEASVRAFDRAISIGPDAELFLQRGEALAILGRWESAVRDYAQVVRILPNAVPLHFCLAHALTKAGKQNEADQIVEAALRRHPRWPENALASAWKSGTNLESDERTRYKAIWLAEEANAVTGDRRWEYLDVLAAAYASTGQFENAVKTAERALLLAENEQKIAQANIIRSRLELYKLKRPYVEKK
jgi:tetratricopeptide (TPR) repeat protein